MDDLDEFLEIAGKAPSEKEEFLAKMHSQPNWPQTYADQVCWCWFFYEHYPRAQRAVRKARSLFLRKGEKITDGFLVSIVWPMVDELMWSDYQRGLRWEF